MQAIVSVARGVRRFRRPVNDSAVPYEGQDRLWKVYGRSELAT